MQNIILKFFTKQGKKLSDCLMIILQLYLKLNMKSDKSHILFIKQNKLLKKYTIK